MRSAIASASSAERAMPFSGWRRPSCCSRCWKRSRSSARSIASAQVPRIGIFGVLQRLRQFQRRLAAVTARCTPEHVPSALLAADQRDHVLGGQRLEIEPVGGVVVGRDGFRVAVDHDGLDAGLLQRIGGMDAAIVELDALADAVRAAAEDDDLVARRSGRPRIRACRSRLRRSNTCRAWRRRTRRRRCRCACRPGARRACARRAATSASSSPASSRQARVGEAQAP